MLGRNRQIFVLQDFTEEKTEGIKKVDIDIFADGFVQDSYVKALMNVTKLWLLSNRWDRVRNPDWAGFFDKRLREYQMSEKGASQVESDLKEAIAKKIPDVMITNVKAKPDLAARGWDVAVDALDTSTGIYAEMTSMNAGQEFVNIMNSDDVTQTKVWGTINKEGEESKEGWTIEENQ